MNMHREIGAMQKTAWYMCHPIRKCWEELMITVKLYDCASIVVGVMSPHGK